MNLDEVILQQKRNFNMAICLIGIIPFLVFVYLMAIRVSSLKVFTGEIGYIMFFTAIVFILGIAVGRKMLMSLISELVEKNRLAAITETTLTLGDQISNPLLAIRGNFQLIEDDADELRLPQKIRDRLTAIKGNFERIGEVTDKLSKLTKPVTKTILGNTRMIDLDSSR